MPMLEVGQKLYLYGTDRRRADNPPIEVTVSKVGRKWAIVDHGRKVSLETLFVDAGQYRPFERCYLSVEGRDNERALQSAWNDLRRRIDRQWSPPTSNIEVIRQAATLLGLSFTPPQHSSPEAKS